MRPMKHLKYLILALGLSVCEPLMAQGGLFNWVPTRGLLVNVMFMPMLTLVNKLKAYGYATNIEEMMEDPVFWDDTISYEEWDKWYYENVRISPAGDTTFNSGISIGFDTRASLTYNIGRYFFNASIGIRL